MWSRSVLALLVLVAHASATKNQPSAAADEGVERMQAEISASGGASVVLENELKDALKDILAVLRHGSDSSKESALQKLIELAVHTGETGREQATAFRMAVVDGGALPAVVALLSDTEERRQALAAAALHTLALDDPETEGDNLHQMQICKAGAVPPLVRLLSSAEPQVQHAATGALSALAENPTCQTIIAGEGAVAPLMSMASFGSDMQKLGALNALDVLSVNNAQVKKQLVDDGAPELLEGLSTMGSTLLRDEAAAFGSRLADTKSPSLDGAAQVRTARQTRVRYDGVRQRAFRMMQGWGE